MYLTHILINSFTKEGQCTQVNCDRLIIMKYVFYGYDDIRIFVGKPRLHFELLINSNVFTHSSEGLELPHYVINNYKRVVV